MHYRFMVDGVRYEIRGTTADYHVILQYANGDKGDNCAKLSHDKLCKWLLDKNATIWK
jgi:hypothetical protein